MNDQHNENGPERRGNDDTGPGQPPSREAVIVTDESIQPTTDSTADRNWHVGQNVVVVPSYNESRYGRRPSTRASTIMKIGRKYFSVDGESARFRLTDGHEETSYTGSARRVLTPAGRAREEREGLAQQRLRALGVNIATHQFHYSVEQLEAIIAILDGDL